MVHLHPIDAKRRKPNALKDHIRQIHTEGQGVWQMSIFGPETIPGLVLQALAGAPYTRRVVEALAKAVRRSRSLPRRSPCSA